MKPIQFHSDLITPIPSQLQTDKMMKLYQYLYSFIPDQYQIGTTEPNHYEKEYRAGFYIHRDEFEPLTSYNHCPATSIFFNCNQNYDTICVKTGSQTKHIPNPYPSELKQLITVARKMKYKVLEFYQTENTLNVYLNQNYRVIPELLELRDYLAENHYDFLRVCGINSTIPNLNPFDYGLFIEYEQDGQFDRLYGYDIPEPLRTALQKVPLKMLFSDILILPNPTNHRLLNDMTVKSQYDNLQSTIYQIY